MKKHISEPVIRTGASPLRFISIIPSLPGQESDLARLIRERRRKTGIVEYAMSFPLHPQGSDPLEKIRIQAELFRKLKALLADAPIRLGILFQSTLGHGGYWNMTPECGLQADKIVKADGSETPRCCPLDSRFLDYLDAAVSLLVAEHPDFTLGDDDMRMFDDSCYCPRHLELISRKLGKRFSREELASAVRNGGPGDPVAAAFEEMQRDTLELLCRTVRIAIDRVDPGISCGCCIVANRFDYAESETLALAGKSGKPFLRINNGAYCEGAVKTMAGRDLVTAFQTVNFKKNKIEMLDESDTCPHNRYSKSARTMHLHIVSGLLLGLDGGKLWLDQSNFSLPEVSSPYEDILARYQGFYRELHAVAGRWTPAGAVTHIPPLEREPFPAAGMGFHKQSEWGANCLGRMGIPFVYGDLGFPGVHLLAGGQVDYYTDDELRLMLSSAALVDGGAALRLAERGFAPLLGVTAEQKAVRGNSETRRSDGMRMVFTAHDATFFLTAMEGAEVLSDVEFRPYAGAVPEPVMPGSLFFHNSAGGRVLTAAMNIGAWNDMWIFNPCRKLQYLSWLEKLGALPAFLPEFQDAKLLCGTLPEGGMIFAVFNYSYDPLPLRISFPGEVSSVSELLPEGDWGALEFRRAGDVVETCRILEPACCALVKFL